MRASWPSENILLALLCEREMHGYELAQTVRSDEGLYAIWRFERSEVYFLLGKLAQNGLIRPVAVDKAGGPARTIYGPSETGRAALMDWLQTPEHRPRNLRTSLLARVYMALRLDPGIAVELIEAQRQALAEWLDHERDQVFENEMVALVRGLRMSQVEATLTTLEGLARLAMTRQQECVAEGRTEH